MSVAEVGERSAISWVYARPQAVPRQSCPALSLVRARATPQSVSPAWRVVILDFLYAQTQALYSHTGQSSLDPIVFFKLVLVGRLESVVSDRRLVEHCALRLDILYFLGYDVDEDLPWHSTISRTRQLYLQPCLSTSLTTSLLSVWPLAPW
jgi:hypothetical protein